MKTASNSRIPSWASKGSSRQKTRQWSLPSKGREVGRNAYLDGNKKSAAS